MRRKTPVIVHLDNEILFEGEMKTIDDELGPMYLIGCVITGIIGALMGLGLGWLLWA